MLNLFSDMYYIKGSRRLRYSQYITWIEMTLIYANVNALCTDKTNRFVFHKMGGNGSISLVHI